MHMTKKETFKLGSSLQHLNIYTIFTTDTKHWPIIFFKKTKIFDILFLLELGSKNSTTQIHSVHNQHESSEKTA